MKTTFKEGMSKVYFIDFNSLVKLPEFLETIGIGKIVSPSDFVAIKMHFGEKTAMDI